MIKAIVERDTTDYTRLENELRVALAAGGYDVQRFLSAMPSKKKKMLGGPLPGGFYTIKQKRYVHAALDRGDIEVPYMRTADLARSWTVGPVTSFGDFLQTEIYSNPELAPYGRFVQDPFTRPVMHEDWPTPAGAREALEDTIVARLKDASRRYGFT